MKDLMAIQTSNSTESYFLSALRIVAGLLFICHGLQKVLGMFGGMGGHAVRLNSIFGLAGMLELVGGAMIILGLFTRPVAFILSGEMAVAFFYAHLPRGPLPLKNAGELPVLYCFVFLYFVVAGPGVLSLDAVRKKSI